VRFVILAACAFCSLAASNDDQQFNGRWDITVGSLPHPRAWWLEVSGAGTPSEKGKFVGAPGGQVDELKLSISGGELRFAIERRYTRDSKTPQKGLYWARMEDGKLKGTFEIEGDPSSYHEWVGVRAPQLPEKDDGTWKKGEPVPLFDGRDLSGWTQQAPARPPGWVVRDGVLMNTPGAGDLVSEKKFWNFALHAEFRIGTHSNSGIALRGRYELQIVDDFDRPPSPRSTGAIYGWIAPTTNASDLPGEWQTFDVRLVGRQVSVVLNGVKIIDRQTIDGLTAMAFDPMEGDPGPIGLQGDLGPVEFRKIVVSPLVKQH
jgi:hypothetical protein